MSNTTHINSLHLIIPNLFLPKEIAFDLEVDLTLQALLKIMGRGRSDMLEAVSLEELLCGLFGLSYQGDVPIAAISAEFDGLTEGCWLRADPVQLDLQRNQLLLTSVEVGNLEAVELCRSLNKHFVGQGIQFFAPHPQRWYMKLDNLPCIRTTPISEVIGGDVLRALPTGEDAVRWHQIINEIQMLLFAHPLNEAREARGELMINSLWLWGTGRPDGKLRKNFDLVTSNDDLVEMFASAAEIPFEELPGKWNEEVNGSQLMVWTGLRSALRRGDLYAWQDALQGFETGFVQPIWQALRDGNLARLTLDIPCEDGCRRFMLNRSETWAIWRRSKRLAEYSLV